MGEDDRCAPPDLSQAVHAGRRRGRSCQLARSSGASKPRQRLVSSPDNMLPSSSRSRNTRSASKPESLEEEWQAVIRMVDELVADGVPPSNREIRNTLIRVIDELPERHDLPDGFRLVLREIDRYLSRRPSPARESVSHAATRSDGGAGDFCVAEASC